MEPDDVSESVRRCTQAPAYDDATVTRMGQGNFAIVECTLWALLKYDFNYSSHAMRFGFPTHCGDLLGSTQAKLAASLMLPEPFHFAT